MQNIEVENNCNDASPTEQNNNLKLQQKFNNVFLVCPECSWPIEIISLKKDNKILEFRCIKHNHKIKEISLINYFLITEKNKRNKKAYITEFKGECNVHKNNYYSCYCFDCNQHLCDECFKGGNHMGHRKNIDKEYIPDEKELNTINDIIKNNKNKLKDLIEEKEKKSKELNEKLKKVKEEIKNLLNDKINLNKEKNKERLENNIKEYIVEIREIKKKYEEEIKEAKIKYIKKNNKIINDLKAKNKKIEIKYNSRIKNLEILFEKKSIY